jgi:DNA-directed RNA polymerase subunit beta'
MKTLQITLVSSRQTLAQSSGEVTSHETFDKQRQPVLGGLYCPKIFGLSREFSCSCGKYLSQQNQSGICEDCGVALLSVSELKQRFGHVELGVPCIHPWLFHVVAACLDVDTTQLEEVIDEHSYWVSEILAPPKLQHAVAVDDLLSATELYQLEKKFGSGAFVVITGIKAIHDRLQGLDLSTLCQKLRGEIRYSTNNAKREKLSQRLSLVDTLRLSGQSPLDLMLEVLPVMPALYRPEEAPTTKTKFYEVEEASEREREEEASEEDSLTRLYQKVILRNLRLRRLQALNAAEIIVCQEVIKLQACLKELFSGIRAKFLTNPLEKTTDFSGHAVVVVDPGLSLSQCGVPIEMALTLWRPFLFQRLRDEGLVHSYDDANDYIAHDPEAFEVLQEVMHERPTLLFRIPQVSTLSMLVLTPILVQDSAIHVHPLVAHFLALPIEGEHVALQVLLSTKAQRQSQEALGITANLLSTISHQLAWRFTREALVGLFYLTQPLPRRRAAAPCPPLQSGEGGEQRSCEPGEVPRDGESGEVDEPMEAPPVQGLRPPKDAFSNLEHALYAYQQGHLALHEDIVVRHQEQRFTTTVGRLLLAELAPDELPFASLNQPHTQASLLALLRLCLDCAGPLETARLLAALETLGVRYATKVGLSWGVEDLVMPINKAEVLEEAQRSVDEVFNQYNEGLITDRERSAKIIDTWTHAQQKLDAQTQEQYEAAQRVLWLSSQAADQALSTQLSSMVGLIGVSGYQENAQRTLNEDPIRESLREGLGTIGYFYTVKEARLKTLYQRALDERTKTLQAKLLLVTKDLRITEEDCGTDDGFALSRPSAEEGSLAPRIKGRTLSQDFFSWKAPLYLTEGLADSIDEAGAQEITVRSPLTCIAKGGVCAVCYGGPVAQLGLGVGVFAAQSIQALQTLSPEEAPPTSIAVAHRHGTLRLEEVRTVTNTAGEVLVVSRLGSWTIVNEHQQVIERQSLPYGATLLVAEQTQVEAQQKIAEWDPWSTPIIAEHAGEANYDNLQLGVNYQEDIDVLTGLSRRVVIESPYDHKVCTLQIKDPNTNKVLTSYRLATGATLIADEYMTVAVGDILVKIPKAISPSSSRSNTIEALLEANLPMEAAILVELDGVITHQRSSYANSAYHTLRLTSTYGTEREYLIPRGRHILVHNGETVCAGDKLCDGEDNPHEILRIWGERVVARHLLNELQACTKSQDAPLPGQHLEIIVRQMLGYVQIKSAGDSGFVEGELVSRERFQEEQLTNQKTPAFCEQVLLGISALAELSAGGLAQIYQEPGHRTLVSIALRGERLDLTQRGAATLLGQGDRVNHPSLNGGACFSPQRGVCD